MSNKKTCGDSFGLAEIIEWAAWVDHTEGTEVSAGDKAICVAHAILEAVELYEQNAPRQPEQASGDRLDADFGNVCPYCKGTGQEVVDHGQYGPQVNECPDCDGTGHIANEKLADGLMEIVKQANHCIPFYAYGDNEAACDMSHRLEKVTKMAEAMRDRIKDGESANARLDRQEEAR